MESRKLPSLRLQALRIDICQYSLRAEASTLREQGAIFRYEIVSAEDKILRRLSLPGICIDIGAGETRGLPSDQHFSVAALADELVGGRAVDDHSSARQRVLCGRRIRNPEILTELRSDNQ